MTIRIEISFEVGAIQTFNCSENVVAQLHLLMAARCSGRDI
jgi:hypothetical protein